VCRPRAAGGLLLLRITILWHQKAPQNHVHSIHSFGGQPGPF
jgi:hypothetical protein